MPLVDEKQQPIANTSRTLSRGHASPDMKVRSSDIERFLTILELIWTRNNKMGALELVRAIGRDKKYVFSDLKELENYGLIERGKFVAGQKRAVMLSQTASQLLSNYVEQKAFMESYLEVKDELRRRLPFEKGASLESKLTARGHDSNGIESYKEAYENLEKTTTKLTDLLLQLTFTRFVILSHSISSEPIYQQLLSRMTSDLIDSIVGAAYEDTSDPDESGRILEYATHLQNGLTKAMMYTILDAIDDCYPHKDSSFFEKEGIPHQYAKLLEHVYKILDKSETLREMVEADIGSRLGHPTKYQREDPTVHLFKSVIEMAKKDFPGLILPSPDMEYGITSTAAHGSDMHTTPQVHCKDKDDPYMERVNDISERRMEPDFQKKRRWWEQSP